MKQAGSRDPYKMFVMHHTILIRIVHVNTRLINNVDSFLRSYPVALQMAVIVGKISRFDVPKEWPQLFPVLEAGIKAASSTQTSQHPNEEQRQLLMLQVIKHSCQLLILVLWV